jgi:hypothetical protein
MNTGSVTIGGSKQPTNSAASIALSELVTANNDLGIPGAITSSNLDLGGQTLTPGTHASGSSLANSTNLTFDAQGNSLATLGTNSTFTGHIYALTSLTATTGVIIYGQLLARNGSVTLDNNIIVNNACTAPAVDEFPSTESNRQALVLTSGVPALLGTAVLVGSIRKFNRRYTARSYV